MQTITLNGVNILECSPRIIIHDVSEGAPSMTYSAVDMASGYGQTVTGLKMPYRDINIKFAIRDTRKDHPERGLILNAVTRWMSGGGVLRISDREDQHIRVMPLTYPARPNSREWNQDYTIAFRAFQPWWVHDAIRFISEKAHTETNYPGSIPAPLFVDAVTTSGTVVVSVDNSFMRFENLAVNADFILTVDDADRLVAICNGHSCLQHRTPSSADKLMISTGYHTITVSGLKDINLSSEVRFT